MKIENAKVDIYQQTDLIIRESNWELPGGFFFVKKKSISNKTTRFHLWHTSTCMCVPNQNPRPPSLLRNIENCTHHG